MLERREVTLTSRYQILVQRGDAGEDKSAKGKKSKPAAPAPGDPFGPDIIARRQVTDHRMGHQVCCGPAAGERAAGTGRKPRDLLQPIYHLLLHMGRAGGATAQIGAFHPRQKVAQRPGEIARPHIPAPEPGVDIADRVRQYVI